MTDPSDLDELASAHLDGTTSPEEAARVEADPALRARVEELRQVRAALRVTPPVDPARRDAAIAAALAAFADDGVPPVTSLTEVRARRGPSPRSLKVLGAAAAVAALALLTPVIGDLVQSDDDGTTFEATADAIGDAGAEASDAGSGEALGELEPSTTTAPPPASRADLGTFADVDALVAAARADDLQLAPGDGFMSPGESTADAVDDRYAECDRARAAEANQTGAVATQGAAATVAGEPVAVVVRTNADGTRTLLVYDLAGCELLAERAL